MSWSPDLFIGEFRPWPDTVHVVRGKTEETRRYVPEEMLFHERDGHDEQFERARSLEDENARLRSCLSDDAENARMIMGENAKLREQMERLVTLLRVDCDIDASWDGLRRFWSIELTESGCLMRDRACRAEAENAKLRGLVGDMCEWAYVDSQCDLQGEFADRMRELGIEVDE